MGSDSQDAQTLRELAKRYAELSNSPIQDQRRDLWRRHNSLIKTRPPIYVRAGWSEAPEVHVRQCADPFCQAYESWLRVQLFRGGIGDDSTFEPWITVPAVHKASGWGLTGSRRYPAEAGGSYKVDYPVKELEDAEKLQTPRHEIDEEQTARNADRLREIVGDILTVNVDRGPAWWMWSADISTDLGHLRGIENFMLDMTDNPQWLHRLLAFMRDGILRAHQQAEDAGDWGLCDHQNQAMPFARELLDPAANVLGVKRKQLWVFAAAQEFTLVSPRMHEEFLLRYQLPILSRFGLVAYGCCEDLTKKIDMLRRIPNLRRIAVAPAADVRKCAEQIGRDYVISYRPNPALMVSVGFDPDRVRRLVTAAMDACRGLCGDITLKDVETVQGRPDRLHEGTRIVRGIAEDYA